MDNSILADTALVSTQFQSDPRIEHAKALLAQALFDYSNKIDAVRPPNPDLVPGYQAALERLAVARGGAPYFPYMTSGLGNGPFVELGDGSVKARLHRRNWGARNGTQSSRHVECDRRRRIRKTP